MTKRLDYDYIKNAFKANNLELLTISYKNSNTKMLARCMICDYKWDVRYAHVSSGGGCPRCSKKLKLTIEYADFIGKQKGGRCRSTHIKNNHTDLEWECALGHIWFARLHNIVYNDTWCPDCSGNREKTLEICCDVAAQKDGYCLAEFYPGSKVPMPWMCNAGHKWMATYSNVDTGTWCPHCFGTIPKTLIDCCSVAAEKDGYCLAEEYTNAKTPVPWRCKNKHEWYACYDNVRSGRWCPECSSLKSQKALIDFIRLIFPHYTVFFNFKGFVWLETIKQYRQEIDIYVLELKLAIEYDGEQHFTPVRFGGISYDEALINLKNVQRLDALKEEKIKQHPEDVSRLIRFNYADKLTLELVRQRLIDNGVLVNDQKSL